VTRIALVGACGHMGGHVLEAIAQDESAALAAAVEHAGHQALGREIRPGVKLGSNLAQALAAADVAIDFSTPAGTAALLAAARREPRPLVIATTGLPAETAAALREAAHQIPIVFTPNFSRGIQVLCELIELALRHLPDYEVEVLDLHHSRKVDAPSGTALRLAEVAAQARGQALDDVAVYARHGHSGPRRSAEIGIQTLRAGSSPGEHTVFIAGPGERLELTHRAFSREGFASGAVRAARWVVSQPPGLYTMKDVLS
jgi:4-hydroxy-tetrahydrodipicolinate reductase